MVRLGVDTGGTFTDFVWSDDDGRFHVHKQLSTPADPAASVLEGIRFLGVPPDGEVVHGSTVATNALLERRGARTVLLTTAGFADVLAIGRQNRPDLYALVPQKPPPLVPRRWRLEVAERVSAQGEVLQPLDRKALRPLLEKMAAGAIESLAVCFLFSFLRPHHEELVMQEVEAWREGAAGATLRKWAQALNVSLSAQILPEFREFERTSTTVINAYVAPLMGRYLERLRMGLGPRPLTIMQSNGGIISADAAGRQAARTVLSGPAGGVVGARFVGAMAGDADLITFDMGGTSTDVALCPGRLPTTADGEVAGLPLRLPIIDIHTVGAGGGSVAYADAGRALHVGPRSMGADPGPACYGQQGIERRAALNETEVAWQPTTTDANLVLGRLDSGRFLGGAMVLDEAAARAALEQLAEAIGAGSLLEAAWDVIRVANATMERALRRISVEQGHDPRRFTLVAFGGAGPLHACELAQSLQIPRVLVPLVPGVLSALGMLAAAPVRDYSRTVMRSLGSSPAAWMPWLSGAFAPLLQRATTEMAGDGRDPAELLIERAVDLRYAGQAHELTVPYDQERLLAAFHEAHARRYGYQRPEADVEVVTVRLSVRAPARAPHIARQPLVNGDASEALLGEKPVWFSGALMRTRQYERGQLLPGVRFDGPAIVYQYDTTTVIPPAWTAQVDEYRNLLLTRTA